LKLPLFVREFLRFLNFVLLGAVVAMLGRTMYGLYKLQMAEQSIRDLPLDVLAIQVLEVHRYAAFGAIAVIIWWIGERVFWIVVRGVRKFFAVFFDKPPEVSKSVDVDDKIKMARRVKAEAYLESAKEARTPPSNTTGEPLFENRITAKGGAVTYNVMASRYLTDDEMKKIVWGVLNDGSIVEPAPGETRYLTLSTELEKKYLG
jgi:hypothetical protein